MNNYKIKKLGEVKPQDRLCGKIWPLSDREDIEGGNMSYFETSETTEAHYHEETTEMYLVISGEGRIKLNENEEKLEKNSFVIIYPETVHRIVPIENSTLKIIVCSIPAWKEEDEIKVNGKEG